MALLVHKYGGTSLATSGRIRDVAARLAQVQQEGHRLIVVVSAMGGSTDQLQALASDISPEPDPRELDMLLTTGERVSMSLLAMALKAAGLDSISFTGSQSGIITDDRHTRARILDVRGDRIHEAIEQDRIVIVAGFQGVSAAREITTLGRGGSDVTAVALATRFRADRCEIYTDVDGVYTANPGRLQRARRLDRIDHDSMVTYARLGAGVLHPRAARRARQDAVPLRILSSFIPGRGTEVGGDTAGLPAVFGIGCCRHTARLDLAGGDRETAIARLEELRLPYLAVVTDRHETGIVLFVEERDAEEIAETCTVQLGLPVTEVYRGSLVSVVTRPDVDLLDTFEALVPTERRLDREALRQPGATVALVQNGDADRVVLDLHRNLIEENAPALS